MKIKLKITSNELRFLEKKTYYVTGIHINDLTRDKKSAYTIMLDIADKVANKAKSLNRQASSDNKNHDISLKWHEAETLEMFLTGLNEPGEDPYSADPYSANMSRKIISQLNQKLA